MIKKADRRDLDCLAMLGVLLWPEHTKAELKAEFAQCIDQDNAAFFLFFENGEPVGFAQCQLRQDYVEGASSSPVGYLEGIFVQPHARGKGYARALLQAGEQWAKQQGCKEFASDCEVCNTGSLQFHLKTGFKEANRIICLIKPLA